MDDLTGTQIGRDGHRYPLGDPRLLIPPPPPRVTSVNGKTGDVVLAVGGGSLVGTSPVLGVILRGDVSASLPTETEGGTQLAVDSITPDSQPIRTWDSADESLVEAVAVEDVGPTGDVSIGGFHVVWADSPPRTHIEFDEAGLYVVQAQATFNYPAQTPAGVRGFNLEWGSALMAVNERNVLDNDQLGDGLSDNVKGGTVPFIVNPSDTRTGLDTSWLRAYAFHTATGETFDTEIVLWVQKVA